MKITHIGLLLNQGKSFTAKISELDFLVADKGGDEQETEHIENLTEEETFDKDMNKNIDSNEQTDENKDSMEKTK